MGHLRTITSSSIDKTDMITFFESLDPDTFSVFPDERPGKNLSSKNEMGPASPSVFHCQRHRVVFQVNIQKDSGEHLSRLSGLRVLFHIFFDNRFRQRLCRRGRANNEKRENDGNLKNSRKCHEAPNPSVLSICSCHHFLHIHHSFKRKTARNWVITRHLCPLQRPVENKDGKAPAFEGERPSAPIEPLSLFLMVPEARGRIDNH